MTTWDSRGRATCCLQYHSSLYLSSVFFSPSRRSSRMQRNGARVWLYATAFFALSIAQAKAQATPVALKGQSPYLLGLGELFFGEFYPGSVILSRSSWFLQELAISLGNAIPTFIVHILRRFFHDRSVNTRFRPVLETNMMERFQI